MQVARKLEVRKGERRVFLMLGELVRISYLLPINIVAERVVRYLSGVRGQISLLV